VVCQSPLNGKLSGMTRFSLREVGGKDFSPRLCGGELGLKGFNMSLKRCYAQLGVYVAVQVTRGRSLGVRRVSSHPSGRRIRVRLSFPKVLC
jgi:hypothetical protein